MSGSNFYTRALVNTLLTENKNGWKLHLFVSINVDYICTSCENICRDAVSLVCELNAGENVHNDEDIKLYCESCIKRVLINNENKCPISNHANPKYIPSRIFRNKIMKANVICPNSLQYQKIDHCQIQNSYEMNNNITDTLYSNEGNKHMQNTQMCTFIGTLHTLIEEHIPVCIQKQIFKSHDSNTINKIHFLMIEDLQEKNIEMKKEIKCLKNDLKNEMKKNEENNESIKKVNKCIATFKLESTKMKLEITAMKMNFDNKINSMEELVKGTEDEKNELENEKKEQEKVIVQSLINIPLKIHSFREMYHISGHPRNLLLPGTSALYGSALISDFSDNEKDWIIFEVNDRQMHIPMQIKIRNHMHNKQGLYSMDVWLGCAITNEWQKLHSQNEIKNIKMQNKTLQTFELDRSQTLRSVVRQKKWNKIKVQFIANHGWKSGNGCKFICYELQLYGKIL